MGTDCTRFALADPRAKKNARKFGRFVVALTGIESVNRGPGHSRRLPETALP